jgi:hypothetical protein
MKRGLCLLAAAIAISLAPVLAGAQPTWERVQDLGPNQAVTVYLRNGEVMRGKLRSAGADELSLLGRDRKTIKVGREDVVRLTKKSRGKGALWGGIFGFGIAAPIGAFAGPYITDYGNPSAGVRLRHGAGWGLFFGGIGAGIGALTGIETTVYRVAKPTGSSRVR